MWDLVGRPEDRFSQNEAHLLLNPRQCLGGKHTHLHDKGIVEFH